MRLHLAKQTARAHRPGRSPCDETRKRRMRRAPPERERGAEIIALDVVDDETLAEAGRLDWESRGNRLFAIGSQGLEYALVAYWWASGPDSRSAALRSFVQHRVAAYCLCLRFLLARNRRPDRPRRAKWIRYNKTRCATRGRWSGLGERSSGAPPTERAFRLRRRTRPARLYRSRPRRSGHRPHGRGGADERDCDGTPSMTEWAPDSADCSTV